MQYRLKSNAPEFDAVDGPLAGRKFRHGEVYDEIPEGDKGKFEEIEGTVPNPPQSPFTKGGSEAGGFVESGLSPDKKGGKTK